MLLWAGRWHASAPIVDLRAELQFGLRHSHDISNAKITCIKYRHCTLIQLFRFLYIICSNISFYFYLVENVGQIGEREILNFASMNLALKLRYRWRRTYYTSSGLFSRILVSFMARKFPASSSFSMSADFGIQCLPYFFLLGAVISYQAPTSRTADSRVPTCHRYTLLTFHSFWLTNKPPLTVTPAYSKFH